MQSNVSTGWAGARAAERRVYRVGPGARAGRSGGEPSRRPGRRVLRPRGENGPRPRVLLTGALLLLAVGTVRLAVSAVSAVQLVVPLGGGPDPAAADALIGAAAAAAAAVLAGWLLLGTALAWAEAQAGRNHRSGRLSAAVVGLSRRVAPAVLRHGVAALLGVTLAVGTGVTASTAATSTTPSSSASAVDGLSPGWQAARTPARPAPRQAALSGVSPGWTPTRPVPRHRLARPEAAHEQVADRPVTVQAGDTLWSLAARRLGRDASEAQIALEWPTWFAANRAVIGPDPDLLLPGTRLRVPGPPERAAAGQSPAGGQR